MKDVGISGYSPGGMRRGPRAVFETVQRKVALRAALAAVTAELSNAVVELSAAELLELQTLMAADVQAADADAAALVAEESALAKCQRPMRVTLPRKVSFILGAEAERRVLRGVYPSAEALVGEAIFRSYAR